MKFISKTPSPETSTWGGPERLRDEAEAGRRIVLSNINMVSKI